MLCRSFPSAGLPQNQEYALSPAVLPEGPFLSLAQGWCSCLAVPWSCPRAASAYSRVQGGMGDRAADAAAAVLPAINFCRCAFCSFSVPTPLSQPAAFIAAGSLEPQQLLSFKIKSWKLIIF